MQHDTCVFEQSLSFSFRSIGWPAIYARNISLTFVLFIIIARITHHLPEDIFGITGVLDSDVKVRELILRK